MKHLTRIILGILIAFTGILAVKQTFGVQYSGIFEELNFVPFALLIILTTIIFFIERGNNKRRKLTIKYIFTLIGLIIITAISLKKFQYKLIDNSKNLFVINNLPMAKNVLQYEFKENGKFKLTETDLLGQSVFYGNYVQFDNKIKILDIYQHKPQLSTSGLINGDRMIWENFDTMIIEK